MTPIEALLPKYDSASSHLWAIVEAILTQFGIEDTTSNRSAIMQAITRAYKVGRTTITPDDGCNF